jgi:hypothetical protein
LSVVARLDLRLTAFGLVATDRTVVFDPSGVFKGFAGVSPLSLLPLTTVGFERLAFNSLSFGFISSFAGSFLLFIELVDVRDSIRSLQDQILNGNSIIIINLPRFLFILYCSC